jgi:anti-sigma-K factor RskA
MSAHEQFADDLALLALGTLQGEERVALEKHLEGCFACRRELERLRGDMALLALSTGGPAAPQRSRERLLKAIAKEPRAQQASPQHSSSGRGSAWNVLPWLAAVAMLLLAGFFWKQSDRMAQQVARLQNQSSQQQAQLEQAREVVSTLTSTDALRVTLVAAKAPPQPQGKAIYVKDRSSLIFLASNMPALPPEKAYELWLIPVDGAPIPAGTFKPDVRGSATVVEPKLPPAVQAKAFAITVEPEQGSSSPTTPILMMGAGE